MRIGVAGIPGAWSSQRIGEALRTEGAEATVFSVGDVVHNLESGRVDLDGRNLADLDAVVVKKLGDQSSAASRLRLHPLRALESQGVRIFSAVDAIDVAMDRYRMTMVLAAHGLPLPTTFSAESPASITAAVSALGDAVVKPVYTSKGRGMMRMTTASLADSAQLFDGDQSCGRRLIQRFVQAPGRDIGATVIGGKFVGAFYRVASEGEWMTTTAQGGRYQPCDLDQRGVEYAERAARAFSLDYTVVDLVEQDGDYLLYEVSAFGGFRGLFEASGIDAAALYARHILHDLKRA